MSFYKYLRLAVTAFVLVMRARNLEQCKRRETPATEVAPGHNLRARVERVPWKDK